MYVCVGGCMPTCSVAPLYLVRDYEAAVTQNPSHFKSWFNLGHARQAVGEWEAALRHKRIRPRFVRDDRRLPWLPPLAFRSRQVWCKEHRELHLQKALNSSFSS